MDCNKLCSCFKSVCCGQISPNDFIVTCKSLVCLRYAGFGVKYSSWSVGHHASIIVFVFIYLFIDFYKKIYTYEREIRKYGKWRGGSKKKP